MKDKFNFIAFAFVQNKLNAYQLTHLNSKLKEKVINHLSFEEKVIFIALTFVHTS